MGSGVYDEVWFTMGFSFLLYIYVLFPKVNGEDIGVIEDGVEKSWFFVRGIVVIFFSEIDDNRCGFFVLIKLV